MDILMAIRLLRGNNSKIQEMLMMILLAGLKTFLKIPNELALEIVNIIK